MSLDWHWSVLAALILLLAEWRRRIESQPWQEAFVFFKHEDEGRGPKFAREFVAPASTPAGTGASRRRAG